MYFDLNDSPLHQIAADWIRKRILSGENPLDFFMGAWACGFPLLGHYQMLPQFVLALARIATFGLLPTQTIYHVLVILLLAVYPFSFYFALRRLGVSGFAAAAGALLSLGVQSSIGFGHELASYLSVGTGLYTQLFGMVIFPWALVFGRECVSGTRPGLLRPLIAVTALLLSHVFLAYLAFIFLGFWWLAGVFGPRLPAARRLAILAILTALTASFFLAPMMLNSAYHAYSRYEPLAKLDSYGLAWTLKSLFAGRLMDGNGLPFLTALALLGLMASFRKRGAGSIWGASFVLSIILFAGRTAWGPLADLLPLARDLHFERFILGVQFFGAALAGIGLARVWDFIGASSSWRRFIAFVLGCALIGLAIFSGPWKYLQRNAALVRTLESDYARDEKTVQSLMSALRSMPLSRVYAGHRSGWGANLKLGGVPMYFLLGDAGIPEIGHLPFGWSLAGDFSLQFDPFRHELLDLYAVSHIVSYRDDAYWGIQPVYTEGPYAVYWVSSGSYFDVVDTPVLLKGDKYNFWNFVTIWQSSSLPKAKQFVRIDFTGEVDEKPFDWIMRMRYPDCFDWSNHRGAPGTFDITSVYSTRNPLLSIPQPASIPGHVASQQRISDQKFEAAVALDRPAAVVLKMTFHPFWRAWVDGRPAETFMVSPAFVAVNVPSGSHTIRFEYKPPWWKTALLLLLFLIPALVFWRDRKKKTAAVVTELPDDLVSNRTWLVLLGMFILAWFATFAVSEPYKRIPSPYKWIEDLKPVGDASFSTGFEQVPSRIFIAGIFFDYGIVDRFGADSIRTRVYRLDGKYTGFQAQVGLTSASQRCGGSATFEVYADNMRVEQSLAVRPGDLPIPISADTEGKKLLKLVVRYDGPPSCAEAAWVYARLDP